VDLCILTLAQDLPSISALYILRLSNNDIQEKWLQSIRKVKGIYTDINELIKQVKFDIRRIEHELIGLDILEISNISLPFSRNFNKQDHAFMYSQLLKDIFLKFKDNSTSELAEYCRTVYADNPFQLNMIDKFERDYDANKSISWYTKESFLYKLINKALRTRDVETLYTMRTFIRHLHEQLSRFCPISDQISFTSILTLYRGQKMLIDEFEKLKNNEDGLLSVSNFLSTSSSREIAIIYAGESDGETIATVFELTLDLNHNTNSSFACIEQFSYFGESEHEWLFSMGTVFRIGKIELLNGIWHVHLTLTNDQDEMLEKLTIHMSKIIQMQRPNPLVPLCRLFARMGEYKKAVELCEKHATSENEWEMKATLYDTLALIQVDEDDENLALHYHQGALDIVAEHVNKNDPLLASYHNNVAISCSGIGQDKRAIEHYQIAIDLELSASQPDYTSIAYSYESMGNILCYSFKKYEEAMNYYKRALELMLVHLPSTHSDIDSLYDSMADIYEEQNELDQALNMLFKCLDINLKSPECDPQSLVRTYRRIAEIYQKQKKFEEASIMLSKCQELEAACPSSDDINLENVNVDALFAKIFRFNNDS
jgi:tetratricopeptide (TPR) repeat protein